MERRTDEPEEGRRDSRSGSNVVRLRDWLGPPEELVPFGVSAARASGTGSASEATPHPPGTMEPRRPQADTGPAALRPTAPARPEDFWGEASASIHDALEAPVNNAAGTRQAEPAPPSDQRRLSDRADPPLAAAARRRVATVPLSLRLLLGLGLLAAVALPATMLYSTRPSKPTAQSLSGDGKVASRQVGISGLLAAVARTVAGVDQAPRRAAVPTIVSRATHTSRTASRSHRVGRTPAVDVPPPAPTEPALDSYRAPPPSAPVSQATEPTATSASSPASSAHSQGTVSPATDVPQRPGQTSGGARAATASTGSGSPPAFGTNGLLGPGSSPDS